MDQRMMVRGLFVVSGLYDGVLGILFLVDGPGMFARVGVPAPNHWGYVHFPALLLLAFAMMFFAVARAPAANRNLIAYGVMLKIAYCGTVFYYWFFGGDVPTIWKPFAIADLVFLALFLWAYAAIGKMAAAPTSLTRP